MTILALDPSGTTETGYLLFRSSQDWRIGTIWGKTAIEQGKNLDNLLKMEKIAVVIWETGIKLKMNWAQKDYRELLRLEGIIGWLADANNLESYSILNREVKSLIKYYDNEIAKLTVVEKQWYFASQLITIHQRDALLVFYLYWVRKLKRPWPWQI
jgi:hypothetical protein